MKNAFYFDHDYNARGDQKILCLRAKYDWKGYALFFATLECLCESNGFIQREALAGVSLGLNLPEAEYCSFIDFCIKIELFKENENGIYSDRILSHLEYRKSLSDAGKRGGRGNKATLKPPFKHPKATPEAVKDSKGEESKEKDNDFKTQNFLSIEELEKELLNSQQWIDTLCINKKLTVEKVNLLISEFIKTLQNRDEAGKTIKEARHHFSCWLDKYLEKNPSEKPKKKEQFR